MRFLVSLILALYSSVNFAVALGALYSENKISQSMMTDGKLHLYFCGTGVPQVTMQDIRKPSCLAVIADNQFLLFDVGDGSVQTLGHIGLPFTKINHVFLTHLHSDHISGLGELMNGTWHSGRSQMINISGPEGTSSMMKGWMMVYRQDVKFRSVASNAELKPELAFANAFDIPLDPLPKNVYQKNNISVSVFQVDHQPVFPAFGYAIQYKNCKIVISGDTRVGSKLADAAKDADVLISEAVSKPLYTQVLKKFSDVKSSQLAFAKQIYSYHADSIALAAMAEKVGVKRLYLTHLLPAIPTDESIKNEFKSGMAKKYHGAITVADERDELIISSSSTSGCQVTYKPAQALPPFVR